MDPTFWDERYAAPGLAYGDQPNEFLAEVAERIPPGPVLSLGEGEGRNALFLAGLGREVAAVDQSPVGLAKLSRQAEALGLSIDTRVADLGDFVIEPGAWAGIVSIFCHLPPAIRAPLHAAVVRGLQPGGVFILESYAPAQLNHGTGGPRDLALLPSLVELQQELTGLDFLQAAELERTVIEGAHHTGRAAVVQILARRPAN